MMNYVETSGLPKGMEQKRTILEVALEHGTTITHLLSLGLTVYIIWLGSNVKFSLVSWHMIICVIGWTFFMNESVLCLSEHNVFTNFIASTMKLKLHMFFFTIGFGLVGGGFAIMIVEYVIEKRSHFDSTHGILGLVVMVFGTATYITSPTVYYHTKLERYIKADCNKLCHAIVGAVTLILGTVAVISGFYTAWFKNRVEQSYTTIEWCLAISVLILAWVLFQPLLRNYKRIRSMSS